MAKPTSRQIEAATRAIMAHTNSPTHREAYERARELAKVALKAALDEDANQ